VPQGCSGSEGLGTARPGKAGGRRCSTFYGEVRAATGLNEPGVSSVPWRGRPTTW
jgi:hypothetical protein